MAEFKTPQEKLTYYEERKGYWERKLARLLRADKKRRAERRIAHYEGKIKSMQEA